MELDSIKEEDKYNITKIYNLLSSKNNVVREMRATDQVDLMLYWYHKTGYKFVPDYVVMKNFPKDEIDNFLKYGKIWSRLMKISEFSNVFEGKLALLKLAYIYGIFHGKSDCINHLEFLLKGIPLKVSKENYELLIWIEDRIKSAYKYNLVLPSKEEIENYFDIKKELLKHRLISSDCEYIFKELYKSNDNLVYNLQFNYQKYPELVSDLREFLEIWGLEVMLDPFKACSMVKGFKMEYDEDFRKFFIENIDLILTDYDYMCYLSKIQNEFSEIKKLNSNRKLTFDLALNYVKENNYKNIGVGNELMADMVGKIGLYSQEHFEILQNIYNYGKMRIYSSIPRIYGSYKNYSYEFVKLSDPIALVIGDLTDCCQKLNDNAELCMEHSVVDNNGRLFAIRDELGQVVAQSWVWRNKNIICFDNIEIPDRLLLKIERRKGAVARYNFVQSIYEVYKYVSSLLVELDNKKYFELLSNRQISNKEYNGLRLNKVIVGLGNNDIANVIKNNSMLLDTDIVKPISFNPVVPLSFYKELYLKDSCSQYILCDSCDPMFNFDLDTISVYHDEYDIYNKSNISSVNVLMLNNLCNNNGYELNIDNDSRIIVHPNFGIIYYEYDDYIDIVNLYYNDKIIVNDKCIEITDIVFKQIELALFQIGNNKKINISNLSDDIINLLNKTNICFLKPTGNIKKVLVK